MSEPSIPLCVDLDGSLVRQDLMLVAFINLLRRKFLTGLGSLLVLSLKGRAAFKKSIGAKVVINLTTIAFNQELIQFLRDEHAKGRKIVLATGNDKHIAQTIADHLGFFSEVIASDGVVNLTGKNKANELIHRYGSTCFDYVGNHSSDIVVWKSARKIYVVATDPRFVAKLNRQIKIERIFNW